MINEKYKGKETVFITRYKNDFIQRIFFENENINEKLLKLRKIYGKDYEVLKRYEDVDFELVNPIIEKATKDLRAGKEVDLETLLD